MIDATDPRPSRPEDDPARIPSGPRPQPAAGDPLLGDAWHFAAIGTPALGNTFIGRGVRVAVVDDGIEFTHPDLAANYDATVDWDTETETANGRPRYDGVFGDSHGTAVAGLIAAVAGNGFGSAGVAPGAVLASIRLDFSGRDTDGDDDIAEALVRARAFDVVNASWGYDAPFLADFAAPEFQATGEAIADGADLGRGGLGTIWAFAAGNNRVGDSDTNESNLTNDRHLITVAATDSTGNAADYSNPGASILVAAPAATVTTDRAGRTNGYNDTQGLEDYADLALTQQFGGTSAATPVLVGVVARMLEAEPGLGWRDVQEILAASARRTGSDPIAVNDGTAWNGGGMFYGTDIGFGQVDARAAVRMAQTWLTTGLDAQTSANDVSRSFDVDLGAGDTIDGSADIVIDINVPALAGFRIEDVELLLDISHSYPGDLVVSVTSPDGDVTRLIDRPRFGDEFFDIDTVFSLAARGLRGEDGTGLWTVTVEDAFATDGDGLLRGVTLILHGSNSDDDRWIFTDRYASLGASVARQTVEDATGTDTLDGSTLTGAATIDLRSGATSTVAGRSFEIDAGTTIEHAIGGDGNDTILGNAGSNTLLGNIGADRLEGLSGADWLDGGAGGDHLRGTGADDLLHGRDGNDVLLGGDGNDSIGGSAGDDSLGGGLGDDDLRGGNGTDSALFSGTSRGYSVAREGGGIRVIDTRLSDGDEGSDLLTGIERLRFSETTLTIEAALDRLVPIL